MGLVYDTLGIFLAAAMALLTLAFGWTLRAWWGRDHVRAWIASLALAAVGIGLFRIPAQAETPGGLAMHALRNGLLLLALGLQLWGWARALGRPWSWVRAWIPALALVPPYLIGGTTYPRRVAIVSLAMALVAYLHAALLRKRAPEAGPLVAYTQGLLLIHGTFVLLRGAMALWDPSPGSLFRWTAYGFFEFFLAFTLLVFLEWLWVESQAEAGVLVP
jgi:hypothetical protein